MMTWWSALPAGCHAFYAIALVGSLLLVLQSALLGIGIDHDAALLSGGHHGGLGMLSVRTLTAWCIGFGWSGVIVLRAGGPLSLAILVGLVSGLLLAWSLLWMMRSMRRLASDGTLDYRHAIGAIGTVIVAVQPQGRAGGQIEVLVQGRLAALQAIHPAGPIPSGVKVRVIDVVDGGTLLVVPL